MPFRFPACLVPESQSSGSAVGAGLSSELSTSNPMSVDEFVVAPERNPDGYGSRVRQNRAKCSQLAADFFKDSVKRARERNLRSDRTRRHEN